MKKTKVYTKSGDKGETSLIGGIRVKKNHPRVEAFGNCDELKSWIGLIRDLDVDDNIKKLLLVIQEKVFVLETQLAAPTEKDKINLPQLSNKDVLLLESEIDRMNESLEPLSSFIMPGGSQVVSFCHITRAVCRRTERSVLNLADNDDVSEIILKYLNRLSDLLFVLARKLAHDNNIKETRWQSKH